MYKLVLLEQTKPVPSVCGIYSSVYVGLFKFSSVICRCMKAVNAKIHYFKA